MNLSTDRLGQQPAFELGWLQVLQVSESRLPLRAKGGCAAKMWELLCSKKPKAFKAPREAELGISLAEKLKINFIQTTATFQEMWRKETPTPHSFPSKSHVRFDILSGPLF